ncbi:MAG: polymerase sigma factor RpoD [Myxococcaceae bacterium]|jgi:RNA polymerase primary sigma factor|nr:polymerase sigma factor RpoD [Myxococcaceae bacterium]
MNIVDPKNQTSSTRSASTTARGGATVRAPRKSRTRERAEHDVRPRARRNAHERSGSVDVDSMYLAEMAASSILTPEQEVQLAQRIVAAERSLIEALVRAPSGARALCKLAHELTEGKIDIRDIVLNPDQAGLDLGRTTEIVRGALSGSCSGDVDLQAAVVDTLSTVRLDGDIVESVVNAIREGAATAIDDADAAMAIEAARRELKRGKERLVVGNLRLVVLFARKYLNRGVPLLDLVQEGNLGLMRAADKFDHTRGFRFSTYAAWWIKQAIQRALLDRTLRLPVHVADDRRRIGKMRASFLTQNRREPTPEEIARISGLAPERVQNILTLPAQPASLDTPMGEDGDATLGDLVPGNTELPDAAVSLRALGGHIETLMGALTPREQQVLRMRFGMGGAREHTLEEVGRALSLTRERIRQIERAALDKLRARESRVELRSYLER